MALHDDDIGALALICLVLVVIVGFMAIVGR